MLLLAAAILAHAGGHKWDAHPSDVVAVQTTAQPTEVVFERLSDLRAWAEVIPAECATDWEWSAGTRGVGGLGRVTYTFGPLRRRLSVEVAKLEPSYNVEIHHPGKKGFTTTLRLTEAPEGATRLELKTWLSPPPSPFKGIFFKKVMPAWQACWEQTAARIAAGPGQ